MTSPQPASELRQALTELRPHFVRAAWFSFFASVLVLVPSWYMLEVYDRVVNSRNHLTLLVLTVVTLGGYVVLEVIEWGRSEIMRGAAGEFDDRMASRVFRAVFDANLRKQPGGTVQPINDFRSVRDFLYSPALLAIMEAPMSLLFLILLFAISPLVGWAAVVGAIVQVFVGWLNERSTKPPLMEANRTAVAAQQYADGSLRNAEVIESMGMLKSIHKRWIGQQRKLLGLQALASERGGAFQSISRMIQNTMSSLLLGLSAWLLLRNQLNGGGGMLIVASVLGGRMLAPLVQVVGQWQNVVNTRVAWERLNILLAQVPARQPSMELPAPTGKLQVEGAVAMAPGTQAQILRGVAFALQPGEALVVVGPSAAGKTTLARLLVGIWPSLAGKVRLDGADVFAWDKSELGPHIGYLPQGVELFEGTLAENIARFGPVNMDRVEAAARLVGMHEFIMSLPMGYDSPVGLDGSLLSGGQRQRIALARAVYGEPAFVVLDEPNSNLDEAGDAALAQAITMLKARGTTFVVMTHRVSVLAVADKMMVLRDGQQQAFGPRDEVLAVLRKAADRVAQAASAGATA